MRNSFDTHLTARDIMVTKLVTLTPEVDALDALRKLLSHRISGAPVVDDEGNFLGVFSEKCSMSFIVDAVYDELPSTRVGAFMNTDANRTISEDTGLLTIVQMFINTPYRRLPVLRGGRLVGQVSRRDVLNAAQALIKDHAAGKETTLLYLSALVDRDDAPVT